MNCKTEKKKNIKKMILKGKSFWRWKGWCWLRWKRRGRA